MDEGWMQCNEEQQQAVSATEGYIRVIAGAGSGKTRALSQRFAFLVNDIGILPGNILCVTFTNKSANEMRQRIHRLTGDNDTGYISTFHGFCVSVLQEDSHAVSYPKSFLVLDNADIDAMLKMIYDERHLSLRDMTFGQARDMIEIRKTLQEPEYYLDLIRMSPEALQKKYRNAVDANDIIFYGYLYQQKKCFGLDYNDLIIFSLYIFEQKEEIRLKWQKRLEYIMIDEFQDIDGLQYRLMEVLCGYHHNLFVVGDPDQTIYTWRGANVKYLLNFDTIFPGTETILMNRNYRSTPQILAVCNSLIEKNTSRIRKNLIPMSPEGQEVVCHMAADPEREAEWIAAEIRKLKEGGASYRDIAVLYRAHYLTRAVEEVLIREQIPYAIFSGIPFFGRAEIKDALSYLRMIAEKDDLSFLRIVNTPRRNIGEKRIARLNEVAEERKCSLYEALQYSLEEDLFLPTGASEFVELVEHFSRTWEGRQISELMSDLMDRSGYEEMLRTEGAQEKLDNLAELKQSIYEYEVTCGEEADLPDYLRHVALYSNSDSDERSDKVKLMTVHTAKGLEFPYVFVCGMNEGIFPSKKTNTLEGMEEERRLAFVALSRAEKGLYLSEAGGFHFDGAPKYPSRFLLDIDSNLLSFTAPPDEKLLEAARAYVNRTNRKLAAVNPEDRYPVGSRIRHRIFGEGEIVDIDEEKQAYAVQFDDLETPRRISFRVSLELL